MLQCLFYSIRPYYKLLMYKIKIFWIVSLQIKTIEGFALDICQHFLTSFTHVTRVRVNIDEVPWKRLEKVPKTTV